MLSNAELRSRYPSLEAIDVYLAQQLCQSLASQSEVLQHLFIALSEALRNGHSCLVLVGRPGGVGQGNDVSEAGSPSLAGQRYWPLDKQGGYVFPPAAQLMALVGEYAIGPEDGAPVVLEDGRLYLRRYWHYEQQVAQQLLQRMQPQVLTPAQTQTAENLLAQLFTPSTSPTSQAEQQIDWQAQAVRDALTRQVCVIAGGPGTGKTYTVARLLVTLQAVQDEPLAIAMAAPTGKAKQRLLESINHAKLQLQQQAIEPSLIDSIPTTAHTLHGLLGLRPNSQYVKHHQANPLNIDLLLVDEVSMVDLPMMARLLDALPAHCRLVLVGDAQQLPSVAAGSILADIPASAVSYLHRSRRFDGQGGISTLAKQVMKNLAPASWQTLQQSDAGANPELQLIDGDNYQQWLQQVCADYFLPMLKADTLQQAFDYLAQFRILAATRKGEQGVEGINQQLESLLSLSHSKVRIGQHYQGKPVMVTKNHHGLDLYNGDIGIIWAMDNGQLAVCFQHAGGTRMVNVGLLQDLDTVYAMTIHKTQGSEFEHVGLVLAPQAEPLLSSQLLYTAITRAKQQCSICTSQTTWLRAVANKTQRWSGLKHLLSGRS